MLEGVNTISILSIRFKNVKSLGNTYIDLRNINILIGRNGVGKTNIQKYLYYFYENLIENKLDTDIFDKENPYNNYAEISIKFDLKDFLEIGKSQPENEFFDKIRKLQERDSTLNLTFKQYKNNTVSWSHDYQERKLIKYLFPIYYLDVRNIDLYDWDNVWNIIGDLGQRRSEKEGEFSKELEKILKDIYGVKYFEYLVELKSEIEGLEYNVQPFNNSDKFKQIYKLNFGGEKFKFKKNNLDFYSKGYNSYNYLRIFYTILDKLHKSKVKNPIVIIDEPEIGLHPTLIDDLYKFIYSQNELIQTIIATHSPRIVKNALVFGGVNIFQIYERKLKTNVKKIKNLENKKSDKVISDKEASYFFSNGILFVEGVTEYEIFNNPTLKEFYPVLSEIEIFTYNSNNISLDVSHPFQRNLDIPYLLLLDMDKIVKYDNETKKFSISGDNYNPLKNQEIIRHEKYGYGIRRKLLNWRKRIVGISKKAEFNYNVDYLIFGDELFYTFRRLIKAYCKYYNVYPVHTTIEGTIVNKSSYEYFYDWLMDANTRYSDKDNLEIAYNKNENVSYKLNILKTVIEGNLEPLFKLSENNMSKCTISEIKEGYEIAYKLKKLKKGSGWISEFFNYIFDRFEAENQKSKFNSLFPELADIIKKLEVIMK
ncbi:retron Eco8 family effector endonuclease [Neobacillus sp. WH10]|uniref:retron Eco8 family effector endonuclease n=1 Tax=Neobacillus sp. WH10 TaxID=3047873 RepID=UPI0024C12201|nr:retron Eco8 family effector endonuclease [Neobacillus sp. WH10]WHY79026.1 retron Eco8 family effector endonuclease [Neobacillus sp. WH10]